MRLLQKRHCPAPLKRYQATSGAALLLQAWQSQVSFRFPSTIYCIASLPILIKALGGGRLPEKQQLSATRFYAATRDLLLVQRWMGHANIKMTVRYAKLFPAELDAARDLLASNATQGDPVTQLCDAA